MTLTSLNGFPIWKNNRFVIGEQLMGQNSGAVAVVAEIMTDSQITYIVKNETAFEEGEVVHLKNNSSRFNYNFR